jgi:hypothetical protein
MHTTFSDDGIHEFGYAFAAPVLHRYSDLSRITLLQGILNRHNKFEERPSFVLDFADGYRWSQAEQDDSARNIQSTLTNLLDKHTNLPISHAMTIEELRRETTQR